MERTNPFTRFEDPQPRVRTTYKRKSTGDKALDDALSQLDDWIEEAKNKKELKEIENTLRKCMSR